MAIDGVSRQLIEEAQCGSFIEPENPDHFKDVIIKYLMSGRSKWDVEGLSGYNYAKKHFDREILASEYLSYLSLI